MLANILSLHDQLKLWSLPFYNQMIRKIHSVGFSSSWVRSPRFKFCPSWFKCERFKAFNKYSYGTRLRSFSSKEGCHTISSFFELFWPHGLSFFVPHSYFNNTLYFSSFLATILIIPHIIPQSRSFPFRLPPNIA